MAEREPRARPGRRTVHGLTIERPAGRSKAPPLFRSFAGGGAKRILGAVLCALPLAAAAPAQAEPRTVRGLTFSDELGGFTILGAFGSGSLVDPIVIVEEIRDARGAVLVVRGLGPHSGNPIPTAHPAGFAIRKIAVNATGRVWTRYDIELQKTPGIPSDIHDGLSFGQMSTAGRPFPSDRFARSAIHEEPYDGVSFFDGEVKPGEAVSMTFIVTVTGRMPEFYIPQRPSRPMVLLSPPGG